MISILFLVILLISLKGHRIINLDGDLVVEIKQKQIVVGVGLGPDYVFTLTMEPNTDHSLFFSDL